jgi:hypothetical protein
MEITLKKSMVITSHLSDVQEMISYGDIEEANLRINFVKMLSWDKRTELTEDELNEIWRKCVDRYK